MNIFQKLGNIELKKNMGITGLTDEFFCVLLYSTFLNQDKNILVVVNSLTTYSLASSSFKLSLLVKFTPLLPLS